MAKRQTSSPVILNPETKVELISTKADKVYLKVMEYQDALNVLKGKHPTVKKKPGWIYKIYQMGFSQFKEVIKVK